MGGRTNDILFLESRKESYGNGLPFPLLFEDRYV